MAAGSEVKTDYDVGGSSTAIEVPEEPTQTPEIEPGKYGTGKPRRVIIRAKITHGSDNES